MNFFTGYGTDVPNQYFIDIYWAERSMVRDRVIEKDAFQKSQRIEKGTYLKVATRPE